MATEFISQKVIADLNTEISVQKHEWNSKGSRFRRKEVGYREYVLFLGEGMGRRIMVTKDTYKVEGKIMGIM